MDAGHAQAVLGRERGDDAHAVAAEGHDGLEVGLDAGAPAGIGPGDGEDIGRRKGHGDSVERFGNEIIQAALVTALAVTRAE